MNEAAEPSDSEDAVAVVGNRMPAANVPSEMDAPTAVSAIRCTMAALPPDVDGAVPVNARRIADVNVPSEMDRPVPVIDQATGPTVIVAAAEPADTDEPVDVIGYGIPMAPEPADVDAPVEVIG